LIEGKPFGTGVHYALKLLALEIPWEPDPRFMADLPVSTWTTSLHIQNI